MSYVPRHGTVAYRALAHLETIRTQERTASQIAEALGGGINGSEVAASLAPAVSAGVVFRRQRDKTTPRAPQFYSLTDHERQTREFRQNPVGWLERPAEFKPHGGPNSRSQESGAQHGGDAGNMAHNTVITTITRKDAEESGSKPGTPGAPDGVVTSSAPRAADGAPSGEGPAAADAPRARAAEPDWPTADRLLPGDYLVHKRSGIELVYGQGELQPGRVSVPNDGAKFALWCDGELTLFVGDTELTLKPAQVQRLRKLLGGGC